MQVLQIKRGKMNKKAGFEMSITTIVVLVIAVIMLILGLFFVRTIMCKGISMATTTLEGAEKQIKELFSLQGEISCLGLEGDPITIIPGRYNVVGCGFTPDTSRSYTYSYTLTTVIGNIDKSTVEGWITEKSGTVSTTAGETAMAPLALNLPADASHATLVFKASIKKDASSAPIDKTIRYEIKPVGWFRSAVC